MTSGKGGVGKTNLSVNLGIALVRRGLRVVVVDADLGLANVDIVLGVDVERSLWDLLHGGLSVEDVLVPGPGGLEILPGGSGVHELAVLSDGDLRRLLHHIEQLDAMFDVMLIDTGAGIGRDVINFALAGDEVLIVTTTDPSALADAYAMVKVISARRADVGCSSRSTWPRTSARARPRFSGWIPWPGGFWACRRPCWAWCPGTPRSSRRSRGSSRSCWPRPRWPLRGRWKPWPAASRACRRRSRPGCRASSGVC